MTQVDYILVGQGIAGTALSYFLHQAGKRVLLIDNNHFSSSTMVASGLINPVTGRRVVKSWMIEELLPAASQFYTALEQELQTHFYHKTPLYRGFTSIGEQNDWMGRCAELGHDAYLSPQIVHEHENIFHHPLGGFYVQNGAVIETRKLLFTYRDWFANHQTVLTADVQVDDFVMEQDDITFKNYKAKQLIFCGGYQDRYRSLFQNLPLLATKGESLIIECKELPPNFVMVGGLIIVPWYQPNQFYVGATFQPNNDKRFTTESGKNSLVKRLEKQLKVPFTVLDQLVGIRPTVKDRRPIIGHAEIAKNVWLFNGMGTKGMMLAPYFAKHFTNHLVNNEPIMPEVSINRF